MTELLILLLVAIAYALGRARDERDRLLRLLAERRPGRPAQRSHWHTIETQLNAERKVWQQAAAFERAARQAMQRVADDAAREAAAAARPSPRTAPTSRPANSAAARRAGAKAPSRPSAFAAEEVARFTVRRSR